MEILIPTLSLTFLFVCGYLNAAPSIIRDGIKDLFFYNKTK